MHFAYYDLLEKQHIDIGLSISVIQSFQVQMFQQTQNISAEIVKDILEEVTQDVRRAQNNTTSSSTCNIGEWVEDTSLGGGWKTCVVNTDGAETRMFYSPCGRLFHSFQEVEDYHQDIFSSYTSIRRKMSQVEDDGSLISPIKHVGISLTKLRPENMSLDSFNFKSEEDETLPLRKMSQVEVNGSLLSPIKPLDIRKTKLRPENITSDSVDYESKEDETEPLLLSDDEYRDREPQEKKRKLCQEEVYQEALPAKAVSFAASVEDLLSACHGEWPMTTVDIVTSILREVSTIAGLDGHEKAAVTREKIEKWYAQRNREVFIRLFNAV